MSSNTLIKPSIYTLISLIISSIMLNSTISAVISSTRSDISLNLLVSQNSIISLLQQRIWKELPEPFIGSLTKSFTSSISTLGNEFQTIYLNPNPSLGLIWMKEKMNWKKEKTNWEQLNHSEEKRRWWFCPTFSTNNHSSVTEKTVLTQLTRLSSEYSISWPHWTTLNTTLSSRRLISESTLSKSFVPNIISSLLLSRLALKISILLWIMLKNHKLDSRLWKDCFFLMMILSKKGSSRLELFTIFATNISRAMNNWMFLLTS